MPDIIIVLCTCSTEPEASRIARAVVEERLAACVNTLPAIQSVYRWEDRVETATEVLLIAKTTANRFSALRDRILALHSYDTPEIIALPVVEGAEKYLSWLRQQV